MNQSTAVPLPEILDHPFDQGPDGVNRPGLEKNPQYDRIRETGTGVVRVRRPNDVEAWLITRYDDVLEVLRSPKCGREGALAFDTVPNLGDTILGLDGAAHAQVRGVVKDWFTRPAIDRRADDIENRAVEQLSKMAAGPEPADLIEAFALPFSLNTICDMLGIPQDERRDFRDWANGFLGTASKEEAEASAGAMAEYFAKLLVERHHHPTGDLLSQIADKGASLPPQQQVLLPIALAVGGYETVTSSIGTFTEVLLTRPYETHETAYEYLVDHPEAVPGAVTELQRLFSTAADDEMLRYVEADMVLPSGAALKQGDLVIPSHDAANRDPRKFSDPQRIDFARKPNPHLSFGNGPHHCIGHHLGQTNTIAAIRVLTSRLPRLRLAVEKVPRKTDHAVSGPTELLVAWN